MNFIVAEIQVYGISCGIAREMSRKKRDGFPADAFGA
jgi:hypothetical protein